MNNITLAGNPNVGKSTIFNKLTGLHQHTGNWSGKTVEVVSGFFTYKKNKFKVTDLPGIYSFTGKSADEEEALDYLNNNVDDITIVVCDATAVERGVTLALQCLDICKKVIFCINMIDEAQKRGIIIDTELLKQRMDIPIIITDIKDNHLKKKFFNAIESIKENQTINHLKEYSDYIENAENLCHNVITLKHKKTKTTEEKIDSIVLGKYTSVPILLILLSLIFYLTVSFASYPSEILSEMLFSFLDMIRGFLNETGLNHTITSVICDGALCVLFWVVSVMLPPMSMFFPLFTLLEDSGYLPRVSFLLDNKLQKCGSCGSQALTMCMGLGCTCAGVTGCRIISSKKSKIISIVTNSLTPCNGKFPTIFAIISIFFIGTDKTLLNNFRGTLIFLCVIMLSVIMTVLSSSVINKSISINYKDNYFIELPPYRIPNIRKAISYSIFNKVLKILLRAITVAIPSGIIIWTLTHIDISGRSLFKIFTDFLDPIGNIFGLDGSVFSGFILGLPANEIVLPITVMSYNAKNTLVEYSSLNELKNILDINGWNYLTAINMIIFTLFHWPCSTAILTIKKETASLKWTAISILLPTIIGLSLCLITNLLFKVIVFLTS